MKRRQDQEARKQQAEQARLALAEKRRQDKEARTKEFQEANLRLQEAARKRAWELQFARNSGQGSSSSNTTPFKKPRKSSMFDYLRGPPPGA